MFRKLKTPKYKDFLQKAHTYTYNIIRVSILNVFQKYLLQGVGL